LKDPIPESPYRTHPRELNVALETEGLPIPEDRLVEIPGKVSALFSKICSAEKDLPALLLWTKRLNLVANR
jgi:hypothetical protein